MYENESWQYSCHLSRSDHEEIKARDVYGYYIYKGLLHPEWTGAFSYSSLYLHLQQMGSEQYIEEEKYTRTRGVCVCGLNSTATYCINKLFSLNRDRFSWMKKVNCLPQCISELYHGLNTLLKSKFDLNS